MMTPVEVREAAIYACIRYEHLNMREICRYARGGPSAPRPPRDSVRGRARTLIVALGERRDHLGVGRRRRV